MTDTQQLKKILEGVLLAAAKPMPLERLEGLFADNERPDREQLLAALALIGDDCEGRGFELSKVASGYRFQVRKELSEWVSRLWEEKPQRYSRALMETLSIIAYRQPITRGDIEKIRGVAVSTQIVQTLLEHEWVRVVGHRDVPGRPAMYATTRQFLDYFNLESLQQLPPLAEIRDLEEINRGLSLEEEKPAGRIIEFPALEEGADEIEVDEEEQQAAEIGTRPISEILSIVDSQLGIPPAGDETEEDEIEADNFEENNSEEDNSEADGTEESGGEAGSTLNNDIETNDIEADVAEAGGTGADVAEADGTGTDVAEAGSTGTDDIEASDIDSDGSKAGGIETADIREDTADMDDTEVATDEEATDSTDDLRQAD